MSGSLDGSPTDAQIAFAAAASSSASSSAPRCASALSVTDGYTERSSAAGEPRFHSKGKTDSEVGPVEEALDEMLAALTAFLASYRDGPAVADGTGMLASA